MEAATRTVVKISNNEATETSQKPENKKNPVQNSKVLINTSQSRGEIKLLRHICLKNKWKEVIGSLGQILWSGIPTFNDFSLAKDVYINRIPGMREMAQKNTTGHFLNLFRRYFPDQFTFFPKTFLLPEDRSQLEAEFKTSTKKSYIAKPTDGMQGDGIVICRSINDIPSGTHCDYIVQEYIDRPLLIDGKKFDLRVYVLISSVKPLIAFVNVEGLARFCTEDYELPTNDNKRDIYKHFTNYSLNKLNDKYIFTEEIHEINNGSKRTFSSLWKSVEKEGHNKETIWSNINDLIRKLLIGMTPFIQFEYNTVFNGKDCGKCFHVVGIDILIDENLKPWLLEINNNPSLNIEHEIVTLSSGLISPVDLYVKEKVVEDAILLVRKKKEKQLELKSYRSYEKVYNGDDAQLGGMEVIEKILAVYGKLSGFKFRGTLTASKFEKLASIPGLTNERVQKYDYAIIFITVVNKSEYKQMNLFTFVAAIELLASKLYNNSDPEDELKCIEMLVNLICKAIFPENT